MYKPGFDIRSLIAHHKYMRTTLTLDDDVFESIKRYAEDRSLPLGKAASELLRRGIAARWPLREVNGLPVFDLPPDSPRVTSDDVRRVESEQP